MSLDLINQGKMPKMFEKYINQITEKSYSNITLQCPMIVIGTIINTFNINSSICIVNSTVSRGSSVGRASVVREVSGSSPRPDQHSGS